MKNRIRQKISWQIGIWFVLLAVVPVLISLTIARTHNHDLIVEQSTHHLQDIVHEKIARIELFVEEREHNVSMLAEIPAVAQLLQQASRGFAEEGRVPVGLQELNGEGLSILRGAQQRYDYWDIFLINNIGDIVFTLAREKDLGVNLREDLVRESDLAWVFQKAMTQQHSEISPFVYYPPSERSTAFMAAPVLANNEVLGVVVIQLGDDHLFAVFNDYIGLGETGELVAGRMRPDGIVVAAGPLRNRPDVLEKGLVFPHGAELPIHQAVLGQKGAGLAVDYRGRQIVAAWDHIPSLKWGLVVKVDQAEAFAPLHQQDRVVEGLMLITLVLVVLGILFAIQSITSPIKRLTATINNFAGGDFKVRAEVTSTNELGLLASTFNEMAQDIETYRSSMQESHEELSLKIAELQKVKDGLQVSERKNRTILDSSVDGFCILAHKGQILQVNNAFCSIVGYSRDELLTMTMADLEGKETPAEVEVHINKVMQQGSDRFETLHRHKDGHLVDLEICTNFDESLGRIFYAFVRDISERKMVEEELHLQAEIIAHMAEGVYLIRASDGNIVFANPKFEEMFGYDAGELAGQHVAIVNGPNQKGADEIAREIMGIIETTGSWQGEVENIRKDGTIFWCYAKVHKFKHSLHGDVFVAVHSDITARKAALEEQSKLETQLRQAQKMQSLGTMAGGIAHEFNNFLGIIILNAEMVLERTGQADIAYRQIDRIIKAGNQAKRIISQILAFSRTTTPKRVPVILHELVAEVIGFLQPSLPSSINLIQKISTEAYSVLVDSDEVHQILINLCSNASQAMRESGDLIISLELVSLQGEDVGMVGMKDGKYAKLAVRDTGVGMDSKTLARACDPFFTTKDVGEGSGMGLSLVYGIMESYNGSVHLESALGMGTTVALFFPVYE